MITEVKNKILELRPKGMGYGKIAQELNLKKITVAKFFERSEVKAKMLRVGVCPKCGKQFTFIQGQLLKDFVARNANKNGGTIIAWKEKEFLPFNVRIVEDF